HRPLACRGHAGGAHRRRVRAAAAARGGAGGADALLPGDLASVPTAGLRRLARHARHGAVSQVVAGGAPRPGPGMDAAMKWAARPLAYLLVVWLGATANFLLPRLLPGDPMDTLIGEESIRLTTEQRAAVLAQFGLDRSLLAQYGAYWRGLAHLDLGSSVGYGAPVLTLVAARLPWTLLLVGSGIVLATILGFALACLFHWLPSARASSALMGGVMVVTSLPTFWLGMVAIAVFAVQLGWLPSHGATTAGAVTGAGDVLRHALMPVAVLTVGYLPAAFLVARAG